MEQDTKTQTVGLIWIKLKMFKQNKYVPILLDEQMLLKEILKYITCRKEIRVKQCIKYLLQFESNIWTYK